MGNKKNLIIDASVAGLQSFAFGAAIVAVMTLLCGLTANADVPAAEPLIKINQKFLKGSGSNGASPAGTTSTIAGYKPAQIRKAYGIGSIPATGSGQTIAVVVAYGSPTVAGDLKAFSKSMNLPGANLSIAYPQGKPSVVDSLWALETALDVQWAHAIAPAANILLVVARTNSYNDLLAGVDYAVKKGAKQVSMSWGSQEFPEQKFMDYHFDVEGVTFVGAAGDWGAGALWPSSSPNVVSVGGTALYLDSNGNRLSSETGWASSGGGVSAYESGYGWQSAWIGSGIRSTPDVSLNADPNTGFAIYTTTAYAGQKGWMVVGGTSAGTPQWAALIALANSKRTQALSRTNRAIYDIAQPASFTGYFRDIMSGCNSTATITNSCAQSGYDTVTGLGSPKADLLFQRLITQ